MSDQKAEFLKKINEAAELTMRDWPDWKHNILIDSFKRFNSQPRQSQQEDRHE